MENAHSKESEDVLSNFGVTEETGLSQEQVKNNLDKYGFNGEGDNKWMDGWPGGWVGWSAGVEVNEVIEELQDGGVLEEEEEEEEEKTLGGEMEKHRGRKIVCLTRWNGWKRHLGMKKEQEEEEEREKWGDW